VLDTYTVALCKHALQARFASSLVQAALVRDCAAAHLAAVHGLVYLPSCSVGVALALAAFC
jgi:hypothetical protein